MKFTVIKQVGNVTVTRILEDDSMRFFNLLPVATTTDVLLKALDNNLALASKIMDMVEGKITQEGQISELPKIA